MKSFRQSLRLLAPVLAAASFACSGGSTSPTPANATAQGATIQGTVVTAAAASSHAVSAFSTTVGIRVTVMNTSLATQTDGTGHFMLAGVPNGDASLRFQGPGIDAQLAVSGVRDGQVLTIDVTVAGGNVVQVGGTMPSPRPSDSPSPQPSDSPSPSPSPDDHGGNGGDDDGNHEASVRGRIESISAPDLMVAGRRVITNGNTAFRNGKTGIGFSDLQVGQTVEVEGTPSGDAIVASKVKIEDAGDDNGGDDNGDDNGGDDDGGDDNGGGGGDDDPPNHG
jgi:hypothetical protein